MRQEHGPKPVDTTEKGLSTPRDTTSDLHREALNYITGALQRSVQQRDIFVQLDQTNIILKAAEYPTGMLSFLNDFFKAYPDAEDDFFFTIIENLPQDNQPTGEDVLFAIGEATKLVAENYSPQFRQLILDTLNFPKLMDFFEIPYADEE